MKVSNGCLVSLHYTLTNDEGEVLDTSNGYEPLEYVHGDQQIISGLEAFLAGEDVGFAGKVSIAPADAYGEYQHGLVLLAQKDNFPEDMELEIGMQVQTDLPDDAGVAMFRITKMDDTGITLDANHPLAGETLHFDVEILDIQDASMMGDD